MSTQNPSPENQPTPKPQGDAVGLVSDALFGVSWWAIQAARHVRLRSAYEPDEPQTGVFADDIDSGRIIEYHASLSAERFGSPTRNMSNDKHSSAAPALGVAVGSAGWMTIDSLPRDGRKVLVWAHPMSAADIAWYDDDGGTLKTYTHWHEIPPLPNPKLTDQHGSV